MPSTRSTHSLSVWVALLWLNYLKMQPGNTLVWSDFALTHDSLGLLLWLGNNQHRWSTFIYLLMVMRGNASLSQLSSNETIKESLSMEQSHSLKSGACVHHYWVWAAKDWLWNYTHKRFIAQPMGAARTHNNIQITAQAPHQGRRATHLLCEFSSMVQLPSHQIAYYLDAEQHQLSELYIRAHSRDINSLHPNFCGYYRAIFGERSFTQSWCAYHCDIC